MAELLKGKPVVDRMAEDMRGRIAALEEQGVKPTLALVRLGQRPDDLSYERTAVKRAAGLGIHTKPYVLDEFAPEAALKATLQSINYDKTVHGCLMFRPLPTFMDEKAMCNTLTAAKDVDGISRRRLRRCSPMRRTASPLAPRRRASPSWSTTRCPSSASTWWSSVAAWWSANPCP